MGKRGPKKGVRYRKTIEKQELDRAYRARVAERLYELIDAQLDAAKGVSHMMAKGRDGKWIEVTDPKQMLKCLDSGETFYKITAQNPNVFALKDIFDRMMGQPVKALELTGKDGQPLEVKWQS